MTELCREIVPPDVLASRVAELGTEISTDYGDEVPVLVGVLKGAVPFLADLVRSMDIDLEVDFLALTRFGEGGRVSLAHDVDIALTDRHVIVVEDIVDTGLTLTALLAMLGAQEPASLRVAALVDKVPRRIVEVDLAYRGFQVGDEFLVGYGLDWEGKYRNLPGLWAVLDLPAFAEQPDWLTRRVFA